MFWFRRTGPSWLSSSWWLHKSSWRQTPPRLCLLLHHPTEWFSIMGRLPPETWQTLSGLPLIVCSTNGGSAGAMPQKKSGTKSIERKFFKNKQKSIRIVYTHIGPCTTLKEFVNDKLISKYSKKRIKKTARPICHPALISRLTRVINALIG